MGEIGEGLGSAIEGGLLARAVEKSAGESRAGAVGACLNCGTQLAGNFCHICGQKAQVHRTLSAIWHDIIHGVLHLDGKLWRTLPLLAFKPGQITRRYIDGERANFVSPMAMFLFSVFLMFAIFQALGLTAPSDLPKGDKFEQVVEVAGNSAGEQLDVLEAQANALPEGSQERADAEVKLAEARNVLGNLGVTGSGEGDKNISYTMDGTGIDWIDKGLIEKWRNNPGLMLYKLQTNAYKFSWLLIPLSVPFVWLMFAWHRRFKAYDHAIFVTYSLAFISLLFVVLSVLGATGIGGGWVFLALAVVPPLHLYKQLRGTYALGRFSALWRLGALMIVIVAVLLLFLQTLVILGTL